MDEWRQELGPRLKALREAKGVSRKEVAAAIYYSKNMIGHWEIGAGMPGECALIKLGEYYGVTLDYLIYGENRSGKNDGAKCRIPGLSGRIKELMRITGITPTELSKRTGIPLVTIYENEQGHSVPRFSRIIQMAEIFDVSLEYLINGKCVKCVPGVSDQWEVSEVKVLWLKVGEDPEVVSIPNTLEALQALVGGRIECHNLFSDAGQMAVICDEEGLIKGKPYNCRLTLEGNFPVSFCGDIAVVGVDGDEFTDVTPEQAEDIRWDMMVWS